MILSFHYIHVNEIISFIEVKHTIYIRIIKCKADHYWSPSCKNGALLIIYPTYQGILLRHYHNVLIRISTSNNYEGIPTYKHFVTLPPSDQVFPHSFSSNSFSSSIVCSFTTPESAATSSF